MADPLSRNPNLASVLASATVNELSASLDPDVSLILLIQRAYGQDPWFADAANTGVLTKTEDGLWLHGGRVVVPDSGDLRHKIMQQCHASPLGGHVGTTKTLDLVTRDFWWPKIKQTVANFVSSCDACQRNKASNHKPYGLLQPLPIPDKKWSSVSMDLIIYLPCTKSGHDAIVVFVDRLTKMVHFVPCTSDIGSQELADIFIDNVVKLHAFPTSLISDRDTRLTSEFWQQVCKRLGIKQHMSTAYHPQSDGQTERNNRVLCDMLRNYASSTQDDWDKYVACAEFAVNNSYHESIQTTPFYLNYSQHPDTPFTVGVRQHVGSVAPHAVVYTQKLQDAVKAAKESLRAAQDRQRAYANQGRLDFTLQPDEMVLLNTKNIKFKRVGNVGSKKLMPKWIGPFKVVNMVGNAAVKLELPGSYRIHNVFHVSLVKKYKKPPADIDMTPAEVLSEETNWVVH